MQLGKGPVLQTSWIHGPWVILGGWREIWDIPGTFQPRCGVLREGGAPPGGSRLRPRGVFLLGPILSPALSFSSDNFYLSVRAVSPGKS